MGASQQVTADVATHPAFDAVGAVPTHGDLWRNNVLTGPGPRVTILDWDDITLGDGALDWGILFGFDPNRPMLPLPASLDRLSDDTRARVEVYRRSTILDHAIDPLADWIEAEDAPAFMAEARVQAEDVHRRGLDALRAEGLFVVRRS